MGSEDGVEEETQENCRWAGKEDWGCNRICARGSGTESGGMGVAELFLPAHSSEIQVEQ